MELLYALVAIVGVNFLAWLTPGPNMVAVIATSLAHDRAHGILTGLGLAAAAFIWALLAVAGVTVLFELFPYAVLTLKLVGATYLVWLGVRALRSAFSGSGDFDVLAAGPRSLRRSFKLGFIVSMTNPKAALFFGSIMTAFVPPDAPNWFLAVVVTLCGILAVILHTVTATVFSTRTAMDFFRRWKRAIGGVFGAVFVALGCSVAVSALRRGI